MNKRGAKVPYSSDIFKIHGLFYRSFPGAPPLCTLLRLPRTTASSFSITKRSLSFTHYPYIKYPVLKRNLRSLILALFVSFCGGAASAQYMIHIAGNNYYDHAGDSARALTASLRCPMSVAVDDTGALFIGDGGPLGYNNDACIRMVAKNGKIYRMAGAGNVPDSATNTGDWALAKRFKFQGVAGMCFDGFGNLIIADGISTVVTLLRDTDIVYRIAGKRGISSHTGDGGNAYDATLKAPYDVAVDNGGNIYIAEASGHTVRRIGWNDTIYTIAGTGAAGFSGDGGPAAAARLNEPRGLYVDNNNLYIADYGNNRVRMVSLATGIITTVAGNGLGFGGDGGPATAALLTQPARVTKDAAGNLYIADVANQRIRKVSGTGTITTYAGNGDIFTGPDNLGDGGPATAACIVPYGMAFDNCGNMYVGSSMFNVRAITLVKPAKKDSMLCGAKVVSTPFVNSYAQEGPSVFPDPNNGTFTFHLSADATERVDIVVTDIAGRKIAEATTFTNKDTELNIGNVPGLYFLQAYTADGEKWSRKIVVQ